MNEKTNTVLLPLLIVTEAKRQCFYKKQLLTNRLVIDLSKITPGIELDNLILFIVKYQHLPSL